MGIANAVGEVPANNGSCYFTLDISGNDTIPLQFYLKDDLDLATLDTNEKDVFFDAGQFPIAIQQQRAYSVIIPPSNIALNSGTFNFSYTDPTYNVSVFIAPIGDECPAIDSFAEREGHDWLLDITSQIGTIARKVGYGQTQVFMYAYWQNSPLEIAECVVEPTQYTLSRNAPSRDIVVPVYEPRANRKKLIIVNSTPSSWHISTTKGAIIGGDSRIIDEGQGSTIDPNLRATYLVEGDRYTINATQQRGTAKVSHTFDLTNRAVITLEITMNENNSYEITTKRTLIYKRMDDGTKYRETDYYADGTTIERDSINYLCNDLARLSRIIRDYRANGTLERYIFYSR